MVDAVVLRYLKRIAEALERQNRIIMQFIPEDADGGLRCPECVSDNTTETSVMGDPVGRMTCSDCGESWEATSG